MTQTPILPVTDDDCPYCAGSEEVEARLASGKTDYLPCPHPCHRLASVEDGERLRPAMKTIAEFPITDPMSNMDAYNMALIARAALTGSAA